MIGTVMSDPQVKARVMEHFIPVLVDRILEKRLAWEHQLFTYPTIIWLAPDGEIIERSVYGQDIEDVLADIDDVLYELETRAGS